MSRLRHGEKLQNAGAILLPAPIVHWIDASAEHLQIPRSTMLRILVLEALENRHVLPPNDLVLSDTAP